MNQQKGVEHEKALKIRIKNINLVYYKLRLNIYSVSSEDVRIKAYA